MIRLSRLTDYAVTLLSQMASEGENLWTTAGLANRTGLPMPTVSKVLKQLTKSGIIGAQRGATGGYRLAQAPTLLTIAAIVEAMDGPIALTECSDGGDHSCGVEPICPMNGHWNKVSRAVKGALETVSLADMVRPATFAISSVKDERTAP